MGAWISRLAGYLGLIRPQRLLPVCTVFLYGFAGNRDEWPIPLTGRQVWSFLVLLWLYGGMHAAGRASRAAEFEYPSADRVSAADRSRARRALFAYLLLTSMALAGAAWLPAPVWFGALAIALLGYVRTMPPLRLLDRPYGDLISAAAVYGAAAYMFGSLAGIGDAGARLTASLPYFFAAGAVYLLEATTPIETSALAPRDGLPERLGRQRVARWAMGWYLAALLVAVYTLDVLFILALLPCAPLFVLAGRDPDRYGVHAIRWSVGLLSAAACLYYPWYGVALVLLFLMARLLAARPQATGSRG